MTNKQFEHLVEIADWGIEWARGSGEDPCYQQGTVETVAHQISCAIVQWGKFNNDESEAGTAEVRDYLELESYPDKKTISQRLKKFLKQLKVKIK